MDLRRILASLDEHGVAYVLVGALGAIAHGARLRTRDVDICPALDAENVSRVAAMLRALEARLLRVPARGLAAIDLADPATLRLADPTEHHLFGTAAGEIDVLPQPLGPGGWGTSTDYAALRPRAAPLKAFDLVVPVAAFGDITATKRAAGRPQDRVAEAELRRVAARLARGESPDYGLEQFAVEQGSNPACPSSLSRPTLR